MSNQRLIEHILNFSEIQKEARPQANEALNQNDLQALREHYIEQLERALADCH